MRISIVPRSNKLNYLECYRCGKLFPKGARGLLRGSFTRCMVGTKGVCSLTISKVTLDLWPIGNETLKITKDAYTRWKSYHHWLSPEMGKPEFVLSILPECPGKNNRKLVPGNYDSEPGNS